MNEYHQNVYITFWVCLCIFGCLTVIALSINDSEFIAANCNAAQTH